MESRPTDLVNANAIFDAAEKAKLILPHAASRFIMAKDDPTFEEVFAPSEWIPEQVHEKDIHKQLKEETFVRSLEMMFPGIPNLRSDLCRLSHEPDAETAVTELTTTGILVAGLPHHYFLNCRPQGHDVPKLFFRKQRGALKGLTKDEFVAELHTNDDLFNAICWHLIDIVDGNLFSVNHLPAFLQKVREVRDR